MQALAAIGRVEEGRIGFHRRVRHGLEGVLQLARDRGGASLPPKVAGSVVEAARQNGIKSLTQFAAALHDFPDWLLGICWSRAIGVAAATFASAACECAAFHS